MTDRIGRRLGLSIIAVILFSAPVLGQGSPKSAQAIRLVGRAPRIDGALDEPVWATATPIVDFLEKVPVEGAEPRRVDRQRRALSRSPTDTPAQ